MQAMIAFIDAHREVHGVEPICKVLPIAPSTCHQHAGRRSDPERLPPRVRRDIGFENVIGICCGRKLLRRSPIQPKSMKRFAVC